MNNFHQTFPKFFPMLHYQSYWRNHSKLIRFTQCILWEQWCSLVTNSYIGSWMKAYMEMSVNHRRASSDNAYNRKSVERDEAFERKEDVARLDRQQQDLLNAIRDTMKRENGLTKLERIRVAQWIQKLSSKPNNAVWRKNIIFYLKVLQEMISQGELSPPFTTVPVETALPNLKLLDLPFPIREKLTKKEENYAESLFKAKSKQGSIERSKYKARSINFNEDLNIDMTNIDQSKMKMLNNKRKPSIKSCQVSEQRQQTKANIQQLKLKLTADHDKQNNPLSINDSCVTRRLFEHQTLHNENTLLTYVNQDRRYSHNTTVCSFEGSDNSKSNKNRGVSLLLKVYDLIHKNAELDDDKQAQTLTNNIIRIAQQMGVSLNDGLNQSNISASSVHFRKASENIRLKFVQTDQQTLEFMSFLHKFRLKNQ